MVNKDSQAQSSMSRQMKKGHSRGTGPADKGCLCSFSHSLAPSHIHGKEKAVPFGLLSEL